MFRKEGFIAVRVLKKIHGQDHGIFVSLGFNGRDFSITPKPVHISEPEGVLAIFFVGQETTVLAAQEFNKECFPISRLSHKHESHFFRRPTLSSILHIGDKAVDFIIDADYVLFPCPKYCEIVSCSAIHHSLFNFTFQDHPGNTLKGVFKASLTFLDSS